MVKQIIMWDLAVGCPYAQRSRITAAEAGLTSNLKLHRFDASNKPKEFVEVYRSVHPQPDATAKVPLLIDGDVTLIESNVVSAYLDKAYMPEGKHLFPEDAVQLAKVQLLQELWGELFAPAMFSLVRADSQEAIDAGKARVEGLLQIFDNFIKRHGAKEGPYLLGERFSYAEVLAAPFWARAIPNLLAHRGYDLKEACKQHGHNALLRWMEACIERPSVQETLPDEETMVNSWAKFVTFKSHVK